MPVYFIRQGVTGPVKIGVANDVVKRLRQLQTNQPVPLRIIRVLEGEREAEAALHERFASQRLSGEWFSFSAPMEAELGLQDLPIPFVKRNLGRNYPDTAHGRRSCLHQEILTIIGGPDALGRRLRLPPWEVAPGGINCRYYSAVILLLVEAGRHDITLDTLFSADDAVREANREIEAHNARIDRERAKNLNDRREAEWVKRHGPTAAWWPRPEPEEATPAADMREAG